MCRYSCQSDASICHMKKEKIKQNKTKNMCSMSRIYQGNGKVFKYYIENRYYEILQFKFSVQIQMPLIFPLEFYY